MKQIMTLILHPLLNFRRTHSNRTVENRVLKMEATNCHLNLPSRSPTARKNCSTCCTSSSSPLLSCLIRGHQWMFHDLRHPHHLLQET